MANGVIITETPHGFVCANGGIDASNVGPASGNVVTLLPRDPDASAAAIRAAIRERLGHDLPVIVSDSFGRPWRWGIVDVAIGVSGLLPLDDLRGQPDADGRVMRSTVRAVADELASAAELALGKTAGRPAGARPRRGIPARRGPHRRHAHPVGDRPLPLGPVARATSPGIPSGDEGRPPDQLVHLARGHRGDRPDPGPRSSARPTTLGFDSIWVMDHFFQIRGVGRAEEPMLEGMTDARLHRRPHERGPGSG